ncbi:MAG TPA: 30S ribosomal protein S8 [Nitrospirota bacterium]|nr:30S ribosomal protein S8 [Nitrospirota bacterium]
MVMTDPIADMLTRIRNASNQKHSDVDIPMSKLKLEMARILRESGFIVNYSVDGEGKDKKISVRLKYSRNDVPTITGLKRISKPGCRVYVGKDEVPRVIGGIGIAILSTSRGLLSDKEARKDKVGGEVLCYIW